MKRLEEIDLLRGIGIFAIILIHTASYFLFDKVAFFIWNWGQFAVPVFVFCSTYLFFKQRQKYDKQSFANYFKKRATRLLLPYYIYLIFYFALVFLKDARQLTSEFLFRHLTLTTSGLEVNWAVLLFLMFGALQLLILKLFEKSKLIFWSYTIVSILVSLILLIYKFPLNYKLLMWLPWSIMALFTLYFVLYENKKWFFTITSLVTGGSFWTLYWLQNGLGSSLVLRENKYPPNMYFLMWGIFTTTLLYWAAKKGLFSSGYLRKSILFLSRHSYPIFFIHFLIIFTFLFFGNLKIFLWWQFFLIILATSILTQIFLVQTKKLWRAYIRSA